MSKWLLDYDSTLADTQSLRLEWVNNQFGTTFTREDVASWHSPIFSEEIAQWMWGPDCFMSEYFQASVPAVPHAIDGALRLLDAGHRPMVVSDRPAELFEVTRDWLDRQGLDMIRLLFTSHKHSLSVGKGMTKSQAAYLYKLTHVVEDAGHHADSLSNRSYIDKVYLLDMPYNREINGPKITRVDSWSEIIQECT